MGLLVRGIFKIFKVSEMGEGGTDVDAEHTEIRTVVADYAASLSCPCNVPSSKVEI